MVGVALLTQAIAVGLSIYLYPVFMDAFEREFSLTRSQSSLGISLVMLAGAFVGPLIGHRIDTGSPKTTMCAGGLMIGAGLILVSQSSSLLIAATAWTVCVGIGQAMLGPIPSMAVLANWFVERRGTMIAIAAMGTSLGGAVVPLISSSLITWGDWRFALLVLGLTCIALSTLVTLFGVIKNPAAVGHYPDGRSEPIAQAETVDGSRLRNRILLEVRFWTVALSFAIIGATVIVILTHMIPWATEKGFARQDAARLLALAAMVPIPGKIFFGYLNDRIGPKAATIIAVTGMSVGWFLLRGTSDYWLFASSLCLFFFAMSAALPCEAGFIGRIWGTRQFGFIMGLMYLVTTSLILVGPLSVGVAFDMRGSYRDPMLVVQLVLLLPLAMLGPLHLGDNDPGKIIKSGAGSDPR